GALDMSLPSTPDIKIKEEEPVEVDSSPPDSPASRPRSPQHQDKEGPPKPVILSTPTPTIVRPGSLPLHLGYDPLHPTLPSPTSVITQAPPSNRQLGQNGEWQGGGHGGPSASSSSWLEAFPLPKEPGKGFVPGTCGSLWALPAGLGWTLLVPVASGVAAGWQEVLGALAAPLMSLLLPWQRLKASLAASSSLNGSSLVVGSASTMVTARPEQSQVLGQHPDTPSPAQPQVSPAQPTPSTGGRRRRAADEDPDERRQRFLERNRAAASRCRQKRKLWVSSLEKKAEELTSQNIQLS
ncbi:ATF7 factor, partial [Prunella fulvescens]|nr:ATF7 factor [Prunella fulvescens]